jgi:hypothetical protein
VPTTLFGITGHFTGNAFPVAEALFDSKRGRAYFVEAEVGTIPRNRPVLNKKPDRTFESTAGLFSAGR